MSTKISQLPLATSPVAPDVVLPVVQDGLTKKASIDQLGFLQSGTGATTRTIQNKLRDVVSVKDFGAVGDGSTSDAAAITAADLAVFNSGGGTLAFPNGTYLYTFAAPSYGVLYKFDGPNVNGLKLGIGSTWSAATASLVYLSGAHTSVQKAHNIVKTVAEGSGVNGPVSADFGLVVDIEKRDLSSATAKIGEIDGIYIRVRNGTDTTDATPRSDCAGILSNIQAMDDTGFSAFAEAQSDILSRSTGLATKTTSIQLLPMNGLVDAEVAEKFSHGIVLTSKVGTNDSALLVQNESTSTWTNVLEIQTTGGTNLISQDSSTADLIVKNEQTGLQLLRLQRSLLKVVSTTTYTIDPLTDLQNQITFTNSSPVTVTLPATAQDGFSVKCFQSGAGQVTFTAGAGATVVNVNSQYKIKGASAMVELTVVGNGGTAAVWYLNGETGA
jgi:hypothetical protein